MSSDQNDIRNLQEKIQAAKKSSSPDAPNTPKPHRKNHESGGRNCRSNGRWPWHRDLGRQLF